MLGFQRWQTPPSSSAYCNCDRRIFPGEGEYDIPKLKPLQDVDLTGCEAVGFNSVLSTESLENKVVHFHIDDYQFTRIWEYPDRWAGILRQARAVLAPDFSAYEDFPMAVQHYNTYRKAWCAAFWQEHGATVIPTLDWGLDPAQTFVYDGIPRNALVSVSTLGGFSSKAQREIWLEGFERTVKLLQPTRLLLIGSLWPGIDKAYTGEIIVMENDNIRRLKRLQERKKQEKEKADEVQGVPADAGL